MHCSIKRKNCAIRQKHFMGGHSKTFNVFGGQEENVSSTENSPPPPRDFINERSLTMTAMVPDQVFSNYNKYIINTIQLQ